MKAEIIGEWLKVRILIADVQDDVLGIEGKTSLTRGLIKISEITGIYEMDDKTLGIYTIADDNPITAQASFDEICNLLKSFSNLILLKN